MKTTNKKTRTKKCKKGGKARTSGGFGCLFKPALKCKNTLNYDKGQGIKQNEKIVSGEIRKVVITFKSIDKQYLGEVVANVRALRPPEPYKGKGVRYSDEHVVRKEAKKK